LDFVHYRAIHHHLFQDVYEWAGHPRTVRMSKGGNPFCFPENIEGQANLLFDELRKADFLRKLGPAEFSAKAAHFLAELNAVHAFREGNGRAQLSFFTLLADHAEHPLDLNKLDPDEMLAAMIASFDGDEEGLSKVILGLVS
jgi:cell filamentation protein